MKRILPGLIMAFFLVFNGYGQLAAGYKIGKHNDPPQKLDYYFRSGSSHGLSDADLTVTDHSSRHRMDSFGKWGRSMIVPAILVGVGLYSGSPSNTNKWMGKHTIFNDIQQEFPDFESTVDDFLQWGPAVLCFGLKSSGQRGMNSAWESTKLWAKSELLMAATVVLLKHTTVNARPNNDGFRSMPSGHTSQAFLTATILHREYGHFSPWYSIAGYSMASTVGAMRMLNQRHWFNDVAIGAALGIFCPNVIYWLDSVFKKRKQRKWMAVPAVSNEKAVLAMRAYF